MGLAWRPAPRHRSGDRDAAGPLGWKQSRAPDVVALVGDASKDGLGADRGWHRGLRAELKLLPQQPALRAAAPRNIDAGFVWPQRKELLVTTLDRPICW